MVVVALFQRHRVLTQVSGDHMEVIRLIPPLMIGDAEVKLFLDALTDMLDDASRDPASCGISADADKAFH
jgi:ornithine--oxo-acid transaminase